MVCLAASVGFSASVTLSFQWLMGIVQVFQYSLSGLPHWSKCWRWVSGAWMMISMGVFASDSLFS